VNGCSRQVNVVQCTVCLAEAYTVRSAMLHDENLLAIFLLWPFPLDHTPDGNPIGEYDTGPGSRRASWLLPANSLVRRSADSVHTEALVG
jgi:hypothetical protein